MPSFADSIFLFVLALLLFGPKKLPVLARELGKWMGEFRRASNEFKMQMEDELRASEQAERQQKIAAMEAAAPVPPPVGEPAEPEHPHLRHDSPAQTEALAATGTDAENLTSSAEMPSMEATGTIPAAHEATQPLPIATSGSLRMMPPATGLPTGRSGRAGAEASPLADLVDAIPEAARSAEAGLSKDPSLTGEEVAHAD